MKELFFITKRDLFSTNGEYTLINNRANTLYKVYKVQTDLLVLGKKKRIENVAENIFDEKVYKKINFVKYEFRSIFLDLFNFKKELKKKLEGISHNSVVVISSPELGIYSKLIKKIKNRKNFKLIYDMHGALEELVEYRTNNISEKVCFYLLYKILKKLENNLIEMSEGYFIVSKRMKEKILENLKNKESRSFFTIPCGVKEPRNNVLEMIEIRKKWREIFSIEENEVIFVYSGGISKWQLINETIEIFESTLRKRYNSRLCIFTKEVKKIEKFLLQEGYDVKNYIIKSLTPEELDKALLACDIGLLLRHKNKTNEVAFPNKFSEYIKGGLGIITTLGLVDPSEIVKKYNIGLVLDNLDINLIKLDEIIKNRKNEIKDYYKKCIEISNIELNYDKNIKEFYCNYFKDRKNDDI